MRLAPRKGDVVCPASLLSKPLTKKSTIFAGWG